MNAVEILRQLVAIPTPSAVSNVPLIKWAAHFLEGKGWRADLLRYDDEQGMAKSNLIARPAIARRDEVIGLAFVCHTDTVPFASAWKDALNLRIQDRNAHGCGACDVKGSLACFLAAIEQVRVEELRPDVALILTADEESGCRGMDRLLAATTLRIRSAIVSEPTSLRPGVAGKGYGLARVTVRGVEAHSAYPAEGVSAIAIAAQFIVRMNQRSDQRIQPAAESNRLFDPPRTTINVGAIEGGSAKNIVAGSCSFLVEWRPLPSDSPQSILTELEALAAETRTENPRAGIDVEPLRAEAGFEPVDGGPLQQRLASLSKRDPVGISFGSEASRVARIADEVIVMGPGDMHTAHSERECVPIAELEEWTETLRRVISATD